MNFFYKIAMLQSNAPQAQNTSIYRLEKFWLVSLTHGFMWKKYPSTQWCLILRCQDLTRPFEGNLPGTLKPGMVDVVGKISDDARKSLENLRRKS